MVFEAMHHFVRLSVALFISSCSGANGGGLDLSVDDTADVSGTDLAGDLAVDDLDATVCHADSDCPGQAPCQAGACDPGTGLCVLVPVDNGTACDDRDPCTGADQCQSGVCAGAPVKCSDGNPCTTDLCTEAAGGCQFTPVASACDDGNPCTDGDSCADGICAGAPVDCNDGNPCTAGSCDPSGGCKQVPVEGAPCDDGNACTEWDVCDDGACVGGPPRMCDDGNPCTADGCDPIGGACTHAPLDGGPCDDGNACTLSDQCALGVCAGLVPAACQDDDPCTDDLCAADTGCFHLPNEAPCEDGDPCTLEDRCGPSGCAPGPGKDCSDGNPCTQSACDADTGACTAVAVNWACDDGNPCTVLDACSGGLCVGAQADCNDGNVCTVDSCKEGQGCQHSPAAGPCDDGNPCTVGDACTAGKCKPGAGIPSCGDGNPCTQDLCVPETGQCQHVPVPGPCDDGNGCTTSDHCQDGLCTPGEQDLCDCLADSDCAVFEDGDACNGILICDLKAWPHRCTVNPASVVACLPVFDTACRKSKCNPADGMCYATDMPDGTACSDGNLCTVGDACKSGECSQATEVSCDDGNPCTMDGCSPTSGCTFNPAKLPCDDGNACTLGDTCVGGVCVGIPVACEDGNPCTAGLCDPLTGKCSFPSSGGSCNDANPCTYKDVCVQGVCVGQPVDCSDGNPCTTDGCVIPVGCVHNALVGACNDSSACTQNDHCEAGQCVGTSVSCDDGNACTDDLCEFSGGCKHPFNQAPCDDGNACTYGDMCVSGECVGLALNCKTGNPCAKETCDNAAGCLFEPLDIPCTDKNPCTVSDWCIAGMCAPGFPVMCADENPCTLDFCDPETGECRYDPKGGHCDDGTLCTSDDFCMDGTCQGFPVDCNDLKQCTADSCSPLGGCLHEAVDGAFCDDSDPCTLGDLCSGGSCVASGALDCSDGNVCTSDWCAAKVGCKHAPLSGPLCDDGQVSTIDDMCLSGKCKGNPDADQDGVPESGWSLRCAGGETAQCNDNCPGAVNPDQADQDADGLGDACETCGALQVFDGSSPPDGKKWSPWVTGVCPPGNSAFQPVVTAKLEPAIELSGVRDAVCGPGGLLVEIEPSENLYDWNTVVEAEVEFDAAYCPAASLSGPLATAAVAGQGASIAVWEGATAAVSLPCGEGAALAAEDRRGAFRFEFLQDTRSVRAYRNGSELPGSPFDLAPLGPHWHVSFTAAAGDMTGGNPVFAAVRVVRMDFLCDE